MRSSFYVHELVYRVPFAVPTSTITGIPIGIPTVVLSGSDGGSGVVGAATISQCRVTMSAIDGCEVKSRSVTPDCSTSRLDMYRRE